jgi:hypothetical protein
MEKYFDIEDIKSLGWRQSSTKDHWFDAFKNDTDYQLYFDDKTRNETDGIGITIYNNLTSRNDIIFSGYIKNKFELKILMNQLKIN